jgi:hypothetical protein
MDIHSGTSLRRSFLKLLTVPFLMGAPAKLAFGTEHFWDSESPSAWTPAQIQELTTKSPWAKAVTAELKSNGSNMSPAGASRSGGGGRSGRSGGVGRQSSGDTSISMPKFQGIVRWVSAKPMLEALKLKLPESLKGHYVISVFGLPITAGETDPDNKDPFAGLKADTTLMLKKSESAQPEIAYQDPADTSSMYFGFLPSMLNVESAKVASFSMTSGPFAVKTKFNLEEMKYHGELSV